MVIPQNKFKFECRDCPFRLQAHLGEVPVLYAGTLILMRSAKKEEVRARRKK